MSNNDDEYKAKLAPNQYKVLRENATEPPFTGKHLSEKRDGSFVCAACGSELFSSDTKFESGSGWPSFYDVMTNAHIKLLEDTSHGMKRTEVRCANCDSHLGHLFNDGPTPTGQRYCINSLALEFNPEEQSK